jgi:hypothetical protein
MSFECTPDADHGGFCGARSGVYAVLFLALGFAFFFLGISWVLSFRFGSGGRR